MTNLYHFTASYYGPVSLQMFTTHCLFSCLSIRNLSSTTFELPPWVWHQRKMAAVWIWWKAIPVHPSTLLILHIFDISCYAFCFGLLVNSCKSSTMDLWTEQWRFPKPNQAVLVPKPHQTAAILQVEHWSSHVTTAPPRHFCIQINNKFLAACAYWLSVINK